MQHPEKIFSKGFFLVESIFYILAKTIQVVLDLVSFSMVIRMLLPIFFDAEGNKIYALSCVISEPFIAPVRFLMAKLNIGQGSPIDWSFFATYIILWVLSAFLPVI